MGLHRFFTSKTFVQNETSLKFNAPTLQRSFDSYLLGYFSSTNHLNISREHNPLSLSWRPYLMSGVRERPGWNQHSNANIHFYLVKSHLECQDRFHQRYIDRELNFYCGQFKCTVWAKWSNSRRGRGGFPQRRLALFQLRCWRLAWYSGRSRLYYLQFQLCGRCPKCNHYW